MKSALKHYREIKNNGGWKIITGSSPLKLGSTGPRVLALADLLRITGDISATHISGDKYDLEMQVAVKSFQQRHGIPIAGEVHSMTLAALNVPVEERIQSLIINLERWRWLARDFTEDKQVFVNIAGYELFALELSSIALRLPVVVGKPFHATPVFSSMIRYIEFNPYWNVPLSIASNEILPKLKQNPNYLTAENMELYEVSGKYATKISAHNINWDTIGPATMRNYVIKQTPGKWNALGSLKFVFPNPYSVYLHDTANPELFSKDARAFSHGCIRVSNPKSLAQFLLKSSENPWTIERVEEMIATAKNQNIMLPKPIPLHITYRTAWVDLDQTVNFRPDIYKRDSRLVQILNSTAKAS
jgi:murein L,D-transpeptidase YcbB/YkuD